MRASVNLGSATIEHDFGVVTLKNRTRFGDYDRGYQNFVPGAVSPDAASAALSAYNNATERLNLFTLVHETAHQLSFNTGMFVRTNVPPLCLSEGLATYVELWEPGVNKAIGGVNTPRLQAMREAEDWIPIADLLAGNQAFRAESEQLAYAESWLLVHQGDGVVGLAVYVDGEWVIERGTFRHWEQVGTP